MLEFYIIANLNEENTFYDTKKGDVDSFSTSMLFPSETLAEEFIEDHLSNSYKVISAKVLQIQIDEDNTETIVWEHDPVSEWN